jgi:phospholipid N-methyltransferase
MERDGGKSGRSSTTAAASEVARDSGSWNVAERLASAFRDELTLLRGFMAQPGQVGTVAPSSAALEQRIVRAADLARAGTVVELGPGTGGTTAALLHALPRDARLLAIELTPAFHSLVSRRFCDPRLIVELDSAERLADLLRSRRLAAPDAIVSGIPFSTLPAATANLVAQSIAEALAPGGRFVAYQVRAHVADIVSPYLGRPSVQWEPRNVPPVRVFRWVKPLAE